MAYKKNREELGANPNPDFWIDVRTKDGWYRKKKPRQKLKLNPIMQAHRDAMGESMKATKRLMDKLEPWVRGLELGRIRATIGARLKRRYLETGKMDFTYLQDLDLQPRRTMKDILLPRPRVKVTDEVEVKIAILEAAIKIKK